jgi:hypothetical protein
MSNEKRIFTDEKLKEFSKDCMELALEAFEKGDIEKAKYWCQRQDETKNIIHDLYMTWVTALMSYIHEHMGEEDAVKAVRETVKNFSIPLAKAKTEMIKEKGIGAWIEYIVDIWRQHSMYPGFTIEEDDEKFILTMNPCGSGGRLLKMGVYEEPLNFSRLKKAGPHTWGKENLPIYCSHCVWAHEILPLQEGGPGTQFWVHVSPFPEKPGDKCVFHIYKDPGKIPDHYYERIGMKR